MGEHPSQEARAKVRHHPIPKDLCPNIQQLYADVRGQLREIITPRMSFGVADNRSNVFGADLTTYIDKPDASPTESVYAICMFTLREIPGAAENDTRAAEFFKKMQPDIEEFIRIPSLQENLTKYTVVRALPKDPELPSSCTDELERGTQGMGAEWRLSRCSEHSRHPQ